MESDFHGVLNLSSNTQSSLKELVEELRKLERIKKPIFKEQRLGDIEDSRLDNTKIKEILGWQPKYSFSEGIEKTYSWYKENNEKKHEIKEEKKSSEVWLKLKSIFTGSMPYIENLIGIMLIYFLTATKGNYVDLFTSNAISICYIYITLVAVMYGMQQALVSIILASSLYIYLFVNSGKDIVTFLYDPQYIFQIVFFIIIGSIIGYASDLSKRKLYSKDLEIDSVKEKHELLDIIYNETRIVKEELQSQIISSKDSFASIYNITQSLDSLRVDEIYPSAINVIETFMSSKNVSIYTFTKNDEFLRLKAKSSAGKLELPYSIRAEEYRQIREEIILKGIYVNKELNLKFPIMVAPVYEKDKMVAVISIHELKFESLTLYHQNLFSVLVNMISNSISKAYSFDEATYNTKYIANTEILKSTEFGISLNNIINLNLDFSLIKIEENPCDYEKLYLGIATKIRDTDIIGLSKDGSVYVILTNSDKLSSLKVLERLKLNSIRSRIVEVNTYE